MEEKKMIEGQKQQEIEMEQTASLEVDLQRLETKIRA